MAALAANFGFVSLFNDSTIGHILRVRHFLVYVGLAANAVAFFNRGAVGLQVSPGIPLFSGEQQPAGSIWSGTNVTAPPFGMILGSQNSNTVASLELPWFYIRPGFALVIKSDTVNLGIMASLAWEDLEMSMLDECELV